MSSDIYFTALFQTKMADRLQFTPEQRNCVAMSYQRHRDSYNKIQLVKQEFEKFPHAGCLQG
jgi:hypothetical protein